MTEEPIIRPTRSKVLVVEDESRLRDMLLSAIPDMGFPITGVRTAEEGIRVMEQDVHDIVILDLNLPCMSGMEFCEVVHERWPQTRVIILTGYGDLSAAQRAIRLNAVDFLNKPASLGEIEAALERARRHKDKYGGAPQIEVIPRPFLKPAENDKGEVLTLQDIERQHILSVLDKNNGNRAATATELGISVRTLYYRLAEFQRQGYLP
jgi:DNA-binding NtrC family response regulator